MPGNFFRQLKDLGLNVTAAFARITRKASPKRSKRSILRPDFRPTISIRSRISGGTSKKRCYPTAGRSRRVGKQRTIRTALNSPRRCGQLRWSLLKKPTNLSAEEKQAIAELEREDEGFVHSFRSIIRQLVNIFDHSHSEAQAKLRLQQLRKDIRAVDDDHLEKILTFFDDHWEQALRYLRKKGMGKHRRGSNSESGMRLLRRLEKNHDGIRSAATRQHYIQIYQAIKYLSLDIAEFIEKGPQMTGFVCKRWDTL